MHIFLYENGEDKHNQIVYAHQYQLVGFRFCVASPRSSFKKNRNNYLVIFDTSAKGSLAAWSTWPVVVGDQELPVEATVVGDGLLGPGHASLVGASVAPMSNLVDVALCCPEHHHIIWPDLYPTFWINFMKCS